MGLDECNGKLTEDFSTKIMKMFYSLVIIQAQWNITLQKHTNIILKSTILCYPHKVSLKFLLLHTRLHKVCNNNLILIEILYPVAYSSIQGFHRLGFRVMRQTVMVNWYTLFKGDRPWLWSSAVSDRVERYFPLGPNMCIITKRNVGKRHWSN